MGQCVIKISQDQTKYVPWLICMDTKGETANNVEVCASQNSISYSAVSNCQKSEGSDLLRQLVKHDASVHGTPTVKINGKAVGGRQGPTYTNVKQALCKADSSLKGCSSERTNVDTLIV